MTPEGEVKAKVRRALHKRGYYTFPVNQQGIGRRGIPDDFAMINNVPCFIEFKADMRFDKNNKTAIATLPTVLQVLEMEQARANGMITYVVDKNNMEEFISCIECGIRYSHPWNISIKAFEWYKDISSEFFVNRVKPIFDNNKLLLEPYELIPELAEQYKYKE